MARDLRPPQGDSGNLVLGNPTGPLSSEFILAVRDQLPVGMLRAAYQGLARAYRVLGRQEQAAEALRRSGLGPAAADRPPMFTNFSVTARDGLRMSAPTVLSPAPDVHVARCYDFGDFAFIQTGAGVVAIDAGPLLSSAAPSSC
jgi:hypothetical protein